VGGSSRTVLEATDRYSPRSLAGLLGATPKQFVSSETAAAMAERAYERALLLADGTLPLLGVGCTATIATDRTKRGDHRCCIAVADGRQVVSYSLTIIKGLRDRLGEETLVSRLLLHAIGRASGIVGSVALKLDPQEHVEETVGPPRDPLALLLAGGGDPQVRSVTVAPDGSRAANMPFQGALLSGSFNPLHVGHQRLLFAAADLLDLPVAFELPVVNADKGGLPYGEVLRRMAQFVGHAKLIISAAPLFVEKAALFPDCVFVVGYDTAARLIAPRYYDDDEAQMLAALGQIREAGCRFLVAGRSTAGVFHTLSDLAVPPAAQDLFIELPEQLFRIDISSTELRARHEPL